MLSAAAFAMVLPLLPLHLAELKRTSTVSLELLVGMTFSAQAVAMALAAPVWGRLADRYGKKPMVLRACYSGAAITAAFALARTAEAVVITSLIQGMLTGTVTSIAAMVASCSTSKTIGHRMSWLQTGQWLGVAIGPALGGVLSQEVGFRNSFLVASVLLIAAGGAVHVWAHEASVTQVSIGGNQRVRGALGYLTRPGLTSIYGLRFLEGLARSLATPFLPLLVASLLYGGTNVARATGLIFGVAAATGALSSITVAHLVGRVGERRLILAGATAAAAAYVLHAFARELWQLLILQAVIGAASGFLVPALSTILARKVNPAEAGGAFGFDGSVNAAGRALAPLLGAGLMAAIGGPAPFVASGLIYGLVYLVAGKSLHRRRALGSFSPHMEAPLEDEKATERLPV